MTHTTYTATISSQGQVTIPAALRRKLGFDKRVVFELHETGLMILKEPTLDDIRAALGKPSKTHNKLSSREAYLSEVFTKKYLSKR
ncbi:AbrB/MazE/SpoVT family DNA-binding domain-containing protein [Candidatus Saccharibacteria bacterium]|nr:AbrB/MazE/SpoVT family DNA-binding domain-containing protein [Candidatus Saccharibacteria bacterium]